MRKKYARTNIIALILCFVVVFGCNRQTEQEKINKVITTIQKAAEEKDVKKIVSSLSKAYNDPQGFNYETIKGLLHGYFFRHQKLHVYITNLDITVEDASAKAVFQAVRCCRVGTRPDPPPTFCRRRSACTLLTCC